jgi:hypothetical protein
MHTILFYLIFSLTELNTDSAQTSRGYQQLVLEIGTVSTQTRFNNVSNIF